MPMSQDFKDRLFPLLPEIVEHFGTPFHIYDEKGIMDTCDRLIAAFSNNGIKFQEFFAVKANPNPDIMRIFRKYDLGFDCSSAPEIFLARRIGTPPKNIMFSSNNTKEREFVEAMGGGGCILNLDDINFIPKVPNFPQLISFRYNPGERRSGNSIIGDPVNSKYGVAHHQIVSAYRQAIKRGARKFGIHTMICSNELNYKYMVETVQMLCEVIEMISKKLGIRFDFLNMGGGLGIPYKPEDEEIPIEAMAAEIRQCLDEFRGRNGYVPALFLESGRYMTGPHGALVTTAINRKDTYKKWIGVDASMSALMRPAVYWPDGGHHHISVVGPKGEKDGSRLETVSIVGSLCENMDQFARDRELPLINRGDRVIMHDTGAHGHAMGFTYNGRLRPQELILRRDSSVELIRRHETPSDYFATLSFSPRSLTPEAVKK